MKKLICLCVVFMLCASCLAEPIIARYNAGEDYANYCILLDESGALLTPRDVYGNIYCVTEGDSDPSTKLYAVSEAVLQEAAPSDEEYYVSPVALMDGAGKLLTGFEYSSFLHYPDDRVVVFTGASGLMGAMDENGKIILPGRFIGLSPNGRGGFLAISSPGSGEIDYDVPCPLVYIDEKGRSFDTGYQAMPYGLGTFSEGFCTVTLAYGQNSDNCIYMDFEGTNLFGRTFGWIEPFYGNYAIIRDPETNQCGMIDKSGQYVLSPEYASIDSGSYYDSGVYLACTQDHALLLDAYTLETISRIDFPGVMDYAWFAGKYFISAYTGQGSALYRFDGCIICESAVNIDTYYSFADQEPGRVVRTDGEWPGCEYRLTDLSGNTVGPVFQALIPASWQDGQGRYVFATFDTVIGEDGQSYPDWGSYRHGLCDQDGNILLDATYTSLDALSPTRYWVRQGSRVGMIDETGKWYFAIDDYEYLVD